MIEFRLPYPVSANVYWQSFVPKGKTRAIVHPSNEARAYKRTAGWLAREAGIVRPWTGWVTVDLILHPIEPQDAAARARKLGPGWHMHCRCLDVDNAVKVTLDALQGTAYGDDAQVVAVSIRRGLPVPGGGLTVRLDVPTVEAVEQSPQAALLPLSAEAQAA